MKKLNESEKNAIRMQLVAYCDKYPSQRKAAASLTGTSSTTISAIIKEQYDVVSDEMFRKIADQLSGIKVSGWQLVETKAYQEIDYAMSDAQAECNVTWVVGDAGCGKTTAANVYVGKHKEVFYVLCDEDMKKSDFIRETARTIGLRTDGYSVRNVLNSIVNALIQMDQPLLIFDEADKLTDNVFHYFINLYNRLEDKCGIIFLSTSYIERRMKNGLRYNKKGYNEIHSRIGRKFFELEETSANDIYSICIANGLSDSGQIKEVTKDSQDYNFDLRRVKKAIHRVKRMVANQ